MAVAFALAAKPTLKRHPRARTVCRPVVCSHDGDLRRSIRASMPKKSGDDLQDIPHRSDAVVKTEKAHNARAPLRRSLLRSVGAVALGVLIGAYAPGKAREAEAVTVAPVPINSYAKRRQRKAYESYLRDLNDKISEIEQNNAGRIPGLRKLKQEDKLPFSFAATAAFIAASFATLVAHPIDTIKTRMQAGGSETFNLFSLDLFGLYVGVQSNILKEAPNAAVYLGLYELVKQSLMQQSWMAAHPILVYLIAGGFGDAVGSTIRVPAEIVNKRLQLGISSNIKEALTQSFLSPVGLKSTYYSWLAVLSRDTPYGAFQITIYEQVKSMIEQRNPSASGLVEDVLVGAFAGMIAAMMTTPADVLVTQLSIENSKSKEPVGLMHVIRGVLSKKGFGGFWSGTLQRGLYYAPLIGVFFALYETGRHLLANPGEVVAMLPFLS